MKLKDLKSEELLEARIDAAGPKDRKWIEKSDEFTFDWTTEESHEVYKITLRDSSTHILGIMSLIDRPGEYRMHLNLLEVSKSNQGKYKKIDFIAGCLIAFAGEMAFKRGYYGFVSLEPKTVLIDHYQEKYGFRQYGRYLGIEGSASQMLIEKFLGDE